MARVRLDIEDPANRLTLRAILLAGGNEIVQDGPDVVFTDKLSETIAYVRELPCILLSRAGDVPRAIDAMRQGAFGYILAPFQPGEAGVMVQRALEWRDAASRRTAESSSGNGWEPTRIEDAESRMILATLRQCRNNHTEAARLLGIGRNTLWRKLKRIRSRTQ